jgi:hypothetical protein
MHSSQVTTLLQPAAAGLSQLPPLSPAIPQRRGHASVAGQQVVLPHRLEVGVEAPVVGGVARRERLGAAQVQLAQRSARSVRLVKAQRARRVAGAAAAGPPGGLVVC